MKEKLIEILYAMEDEKYEYISFDLFDTLVVRPFYNPDDLFGLLDNLFESYIQANISFKRIRTDGEKACREKMKFMHPEYQDVTLTEIYDYIASTYQIPDKICKKLMEKEVELEKKYICQRKTGKLLYDTAVSANKKIIITSDMYLEMDTIEQILQLNGYAGYEKIFLSSSERVLKSTGDLFSRIVQTLDIEPVSILHIGDSWVNDIVNAGEKGLAASHFPRTLDVFENKDKQYGTNGCGHIAEKISGSFIDYEQVKKSVGYGCMTAMAANKFFDNPFTVFKEYTDFNRNPYFIGYYLVGMHLAGILKWIERTVNDRYSKVWFTSRDGWLIMKAYVLYREIINPNLPPADYLYVSRKSMMPLIVSNKYDIFDLPINIENYSVEKVIKLLSFCTDDNKIPALQNYCKEEEYEYSQNFENIYVYQKFIQFYADNLYDEEKHRRNKAVIEKYFKIVGENSAMFDMGYSGRIQRAICAATGSREDALFIHSDAERHYKMERLGKFIINDFYGFTPVISNALREFILSEDGPSCVGYSDREGKAVPIFEKKENDKKVKELIRHIQNGAMDFLNDFYGKFKDDLNLINFKEQEISLPFEGFLRHHKESDRRIFEIVEFEDEVWGGEKKINLQKLVGDRLAWLPIYDE